MDERGVTISVGGRRVPALAVGIVGSIVAHGAILGGLTLIPLDREPEFLAPAPEYSVGNPIHVRIVPARPVEARTDAERERFVDSVQLPERDRSEQPEQQPAPRFMTERAVAPVDSAALRESLDGLFALADRVGSIEIPRLVSAERECEESPAPAPPPLPASAAQTPAEEEPARPSEPALAAPEAHGGVDRAVRVIDLPQPVYPRRSIRLEQQGTATVEVTVCADGTVEGVRLRTSSGHALLDEAAIDAARKGRFRPALLDGDPVGASVIVPVEFRLVDS